MAALRVDRKFYRANLVFPVEGTGDLIVFESSVHKEISGREVFLFGADGTVIWQINPETGTTENRAHDFDRSVETTEPFVNVWEAYGEYYASRINGDSFRPDLVSGLATHSGQNMN